MKGFLITIGVIFGLIILIVGGIAIKIAFFPVNTASKLVDTAYQTQDKVLNADNAIYNYEWFKQQKEDIDALGTKIQTAQGQLDSFEKSAGAMKDWSFEEQNQDSQLHTIVTGLTNMQTQAIADYNARSKMADRNIFKNGILPGYIDSLTFIKR